MGNVIPFRKGAPISKGRRGLRVKAVWIHPKRGDLWVVERILKGKVYLRQRNDWRVSKCLLVASLLRHYEEMSEYQRKNKEYLEALKKKNEPE